MCCCSADPQSMNVFPVCMLIAVVSVNVDDVFTGGASSIWTAFSSCLQGIKAQTCSLLWKGGGVQVQG